jgi:hypothetical protein
MSEGSGAETYLHFPIDSISSTKSSLWTIDSPRDVVAHVRTTLSVRAVSCHMTSVAADTTNDVGREVALFGTIIFTMTDLTT